MLEELLYQLDTQGLDISSSWESSGEDSIAAALGNMEPAIWRVAQLEGATLQWGSGTT
jgi:hypothetical protein